MNTDRLIDQLHEANSLHRQQETHHPTPPQRRLWMPAAAAVAVALIAVLPLRHRSSNPLPAAATVYCNSQCSPDDVRALLDENINHIRNIQAL